MFLAGDSSLDNKHWLFSPGGRKLITDRCVVDAVNGMETILSPARSVPDVAHWLNKICVESKTQNWACLNTAIEESSLGQRQGSLLSQDDFIRDNITTNDVIVCCVGGNDIALKPTPTIIQSAVSLARSATVSFGNFIAGSDSILHRTHKFPMAPHQDSLHL
jgi:hypothetical protein